jgi:ligand-binding sensor domain-containing protein
MRFVLLSIILLGGVASAPAQSTPKLHVSVLELEGFVAVGGGKTGAAGPFRHETDTSWAHLGWGNTRNFGLDAVPSDPGSMFLACGNGVLRTLDDGASWKITTGWEITEVLDVVVDPNAPTHVYAATAYGVWRSPDRGDTWTEVNAGIPAPQSTFTQTIEVDRRHAGHLVVGSEEGLFRTMSGGASWAPVGPRDVAIREVTQSTADPQLWVAGTEEKSVMISRDGGKTWAFVEAGIETVHAVAVDPADPNRLAAAGYEGGVHVSEDGGETWRQTGLPDRRIHALTFDVRRTGRLWAGTLGDGVFHVEEAGTGWKHAGLDGAVVRDMQFLEVPSQEGVGSDAR